MTPKEFEENYIFNKYKDAAFKSCKDFRKKVEKFINIDVRDVYAKIVKYQINTYGETLTCNSFNDEWLPIKQLNENSNNRRKSREKTRGIYKSKKLDRWRIYE